MDIVIIFNILFLSYKLYSNILLKKISSIPVTIG